MHKDRLLSVRFTQDEYRGLVERARRARMTVSEYVRLSMLPGEDPDTELKHAYAATPPIWD